MNAVHLSAETTSEIATEEDAMELSTDFERSFVEDEDIDIDLGQAGKSPYGREDDYMLEDMNSLEDQITYYDGQDHNDDEMADETEILQVVTDVPGHGISGAYEDTAGFDILVDDEDLLDEEDTISATDTGTRHILSSSSLQESSGSDLQQTDNRNLIDNHSSTTETDWNDKKDNKATGSMWQLSKVLHVINKDEPSCSEDFLHHHGNEVSASHTLIEFSGNDKFHEGDIVDPQNTITGSPTSGNDGNGTRLGESPNQDHRESSYKSPRIADHHIAWENTYNEENLIGGNQVNHIPEQKILPKSAEAQVVDEFQPKSDLPLQDTTGIDESQKESSRIIVDPVQRLPENEHSEHDEVTQDFNCLYPVIVVYQNSEISLFPPREHDDESQTYFLEDEMLANESMKGLLGACRIVLADSLGEHDELEMKAISLGLEVSETCTESSIITLNQLIDVYLQLHRNDGNTHPGPLRMILSTKRNLLRRLNYLNGALARGAGFVDIASAEKQRLSESLKDELEFQVEPQQDNLRSIASEPKSETRSSDGGAETSEQTGRVSIEPFGVDSAQATPLVSKYSEIQEDCQYDEVKVLGTPREDDIKDAGILLPDESGVSNIHYRDTGEQARLVDSDDTIPNIGAAGILALNPASLEARGIDEIDYEYHNNDLNISSGASSTLEGDLSDGAADLDHDTQQQFGGSLIATEHLGRNIEDVNPHSPGAQISESAHRSHEEISLEGSEFLDQEAASDNVDPESGSMSTSGIVNKDRNSTIEALPISGIDPRASGNLSDIDNDEITYEEEPNDKTPGKTDKPTIMFKGRHIEAQDNHEFEIDQEIHEGSLKRLRVEEGDEEYNELNLREDTQGAYRSYLNEISLLTEIDQNLNGFAP